MVQPDSTLIEGKGVSGVGKFMQPDERAPFDDPDSSSKRARAFVSVKRHVKESFVPLDAAVEVTDRQSHVCDGRQVRHGSLPVRVVLNRSLVIVVGTCRWPGIVTRCSALPGAVGILKV